MTQVIASRYALEAEIGHGGMGAVWRGRDQLLGRTVALKKIGYAPGGLTPDAVRAQREAQLAARLSHANIIAVFDLVHEDDQQWLVMEYVDGTDLSAMIRSRGALTPDEAAPLLAQTAAALAAAHGAGIVHRDVKPSNILVTPTGQVKLSDFGIARTAADPVLTQTGLVTGSPAYLSPEVASGQSAGPASDVWSWGATLFHAVEGHPPYEMGDNLLGALYRIVHEEPPQPRSAGWLTPAVLGTMTRDPQARWAIADARGFLDAGAGRGRPVPVAARTGRGQAAPHDGATTVLPSSAPVPPPPARPLTGPPPPPPGADPGPRRGRPRWLVPALLVLLLVAVVVGAFWAGLGRGDDDVPATLPNTSASKSPSPSSSAPTPSATPTPSPSGTPTAEQMESFVASYLQTAAADPASGFTQLTPAFQRASGGLEGYSGFWGSVTRTKLLGQVQADPDTLQVRYEYRYWQRGGGSTTDDVTLQLASDNGRLLIAGEL